MRGEKSLRHHRGLIRVPNALQSVFCENRAAALQYSLHLRGVLRVHIRLNVLGRKYLQQAGVVHKPHRVGIVWIHLPRGQRQSLGDDHVGRAKLVRKRSLALEQGKVARFPLRSIFSRRGCLRRQTDGKEYCRQHPNHQRRKSGSYGGRKRAWLSIAHYAPPSPAGGVPAPPPPVGAAVGSASAHNSSTAIAFRLFCEEPLVSVPSSMGASELGGSARPTRPRPPCREAIALCASA